MKVRLKNKWISVESKLQAVQIAEAHELDSGLHLDSGYVITAEESQAIRYPDQYIFHNGAVRERTSDDDLKERKAHHDLWIAEQQDRFVKDFTKNPSDTEVSMWPKNVESATAYLAGTATDAQISDIDEQLTISEKSMPDNQGRAYWSLVVISVKNPFVDKLRSLASGIKRRDQEYAETVTAEGDFNREFDQLEAATKAEALGDNYNVNLSIQENLQQGNIAGKAGEALVYLASLKQALAQQLQAE